MSTTLQRSRTPSGAAYAVLGEGEPLVLIHGVGMRLEAWMPQIKALSQHFRMFAVDLPGHGESAPLRGAANLKDFVGWFGEVLRDLELEKASVAGHSMGALIAGGIAAEEPGIVARVALLNGVYRREDAARKAVIARAAEITSGNFNREAPLKRWFSPEHEHEEAYKLCRELLACVDAGGYAAAYSAFATGDSVYADQWPDVACPALFLTGDGDMNSTPEMARAMAAVTPRGKAVIVVGHRHMVNLTAPDAVNHALVAWMRMEPEAKGERP
jgi:pimeloyl-ACP methyl ester carboxylesterase